MEDRPVSDEKSDLKNKRVQDVIDLLLAVDNKAQPF
jgi:hypothetical protein